MNFRLAWIALVVACGGGGDPMMMDDPRWENARLEIVGASAVNLQWGDTADLTVRYVDQDDAPIEGAPIDFAIEGDDGGSRLAALQGFTDINGTARMTLTAGMTNTMFRVVVTPPADGDPVQFDVAVSDTAIGSITVNMLYSGDRELASFEARLFDGESCSGLDPTALPAEVRTVSAAALSERPGFAGVDPGTTYTVVVLAQNGRTQLSAFGCADLIVVAAGADTEVDVTLNEQPLPLDFVGVWDLDNQFDFGGALPPSTEDVINVIGELADDDVTDIDGNPDFETSDDDGDGIAPEYGVDPGAFVTDIAMRQTCDWECSSGEDYGECSIGHRLGDIGAIYEEVFNTWNGAQSRFFGGCAAWEVVKTPFQNQINANAPAAFNSAWLQLASDLSNAITNAQFTSRLTITPSAGGEFQVPIEHELLEMRVPFRPLGGGSEVAMFALEDAGFVSIPATETATVDGTTLIIPDHSFDMNWGELTLYIYREVLLPGVFGVESTGELIAGWVDCMQIAQWLEAEIERLFVFSPSVSTLRGYCMDGLNAIGTLLEDELAGRIDAPGTLTIRGTAMGADVDDATGRVGELANGMWEGTFAEETMERDLTGTFTGVRAP